jgi:hypothetical protein
MCIKIKIVLSVETKRLSLKFQWNFKECKINKRELCSWNWKTHTLWFQNWQQIYSNKNMVMAYRQTYMQSRTESPEVSLIICCKFTFKNGAKTIQWEVTSKMILEKLDN